MLKKESQAGTNAQQSTNDDVNSSSHTIGKPNVVRSPNIVSTEKAVEKFEQSKKNGYGRFVFCEEGKVIGVEMATLPDTNNVLIPTDDKV